jgi:hypothetical protein
MLFDIGSNIGSWALANINTCDKIISITLGYNIGHPLWKSVKESNPEEFFRNRETL